MKKFTQQNNFLSRIGKIRGLFFGVLFLCSSVSLFSQPIFSIVGNGTTFNSSTSYPAPYGNWFFGSRHQMLVTAAELTTAGVSAGANMLSIGLDIAGLNSAVPHQNWVVTVYTTTAADPIATAWVTAGAVASSTMVTATGTVGWNQTAISPFVWNGTDNLVIETCFVNPGGYTQNYSTYYQTNLTGPEVKTRYVFQDNISACPAGLGSTSTNTRPNIRFEWEYLTPCSGTPGANTVVTPTFQVCPNSIVGAIGLANSYTVSGLNYQWLSSTISNVGPFTPISGANGWGYSVPGLTTTTYYQAVITCTLSNQSYTTLGSSVVVAAQTTSTVPYYEDFEGIGTNNRLPNCSWWASNLGGTVKTSTASMSNNRVPLSGISFAFYELPSSNNYMYTNGIWMDAGVTYSAATHYATEYFGYNNWSNLSIHVGPNQSPTGLVQVASVSPAVSGPYKLLSNTFTVPSSGFYYVAIRATGSAGSAMYLCIDDISVTVPCTPASGNSPTVGLSASSTTICAGDQVSLVGSGADAYAWSEGSTTSNIAVTPMNTTTYTMIGTNTLTGCSQTLTQMINVNESPFVFASTNKNEICPGETAYITAYGAASYAWTNGGSNAVIAVSPTVTATYSVIGTNSLGCSGTAGVQITVKPLPTVSALASKPDYCAGEAVSLTGNGAVSYDWYSSTSSQLLSGNPINTVLYAPTTFSVYGTGSNGCTGQTLLTVNVEACNGISNIQYSAGGLKFYPNPTNGKFSIESSVGTIDEVEVTDISGRVIKTIKGESEKVQIELTNLASGIYYARVISGDTSESIRVIKN